MNLYNLIFTTKAPQKYYRHLLFWTGWLAYLTSSQLLNNNYQNWLTSSVNFYELVKVPLLEVIIEIVFLYPLIYLFIPKYLHNINRPWLFILIPVYTLLFFTFYYLIQDKTSAIFIYNLWFCIGNFIGIGPVFISSLFIVMQMVKNYYTRMEEKEILEREKIGAELQFLKAQVHPHFLFNTLNNIYSFTLTRSPQAVTLVKKLKDLLYYMTDDCRAEKVSLEKELKVLTDYIALEKVRYGDELNIQIEMKGEYENVMITPLLMIPFVENSFKHGASKILKHPWIKLCIHIEGKQLCFSVSNNKPPEVTHARVGIGLKNVTKRLQLLYPNSHSLIVESTDEIFTVKMQVALQTTHQESAAFA